MNILITIQHDNYTYRYTVKHKVIDDRTEHFTLVAKNKTLVISSNRPYLRKHPGLKKWEPELKLIEGEISNVSFLEKIYQAIASYFDRLPIDKTSGKARK